MSEESRTPGQDAEATAAEQGYVEPTPAAPTQQAQAQKEARANEIRRRNLAATFGSGPGKLALIATAVILIVFVVFAANGFMRSKQVIDQSEVNAPKTPANRVTTNAVTPTEAARRAEQSRQEAEQARNQGGSYQPGFDYNVGNPPPGKNGPVAMMPTTAASGPVGGLPSGQADAALRANQQEQERVRNEMAQNEARLGAEVKALESQRDKYAESIKDEIIKQIGGMYASQGAESLNALGSYSQASYYTPAPAQAASGAGAAGQGGHADVAKKTLIKAGSTYYATLDSEANTDDGRLVMATVRSGKYKGAKLIGNLEQTNNNIQLSFSTLAPTDERPTMRIRAVALREEDAKVGMAENIDHHTLSRYSSLAVAALLQGAGRVAMQPSTTTYLTSSGIITTVDQSTNRQALGGAIGEMGSAIGSEIRRRGYNQPSTYSTPAQKGFMLYFLEDVAGNADGTGTGVNAGNLVPIGAENGAQLGRPWDTGTMGNPNGNPYGGNPYGGNPYGNNLPPVYSAPGYGGAQYPGVFPGYRIN